MTVDSERVARALEWADKVTAPGSGLSAVTVRATVVELAHLVRDLTGEIEADVEPPPCPQCGEPCHKVPTPTYGFATNWVPWVWGHDCDPT